VSNTLSLRQSFLFGVRSSLSKPRSCYMWSFLAPPLAQRPLMVVPVLHRCSA